MMQAQPPNRPAWLPYVIGTVVVAMLGSLGLWQVARGLDKRAGLEAYSSDGGFERYYADMEVRPFQPLRVDGTYWPERQILLDNMGLEEMRRAVELRGPGGPVLEASGGVTLKSVRAIADKVAMIHDGKIRWSGPASEMDTTDDPYVRQFVSGSAEGPIEAVR